MDSNSLILLDCTLRDGGYYNSWDFDKEIVNRYLHSIATAGINVIEIGFRNPAKNKFLGAFAYCRDYFLQQLPLPEQCKIAVMIDAKDFSGDTKTIITKVDELFSKKTQSPVDIVRICSQLEGIKTAETLAKRLNELGYQICVNLMQIAGKNSEQISNAIKEINKWNAVDILYFADSLGS
ncbi:MAG TPA: pyruvate carboxyltransferase, partial [Phycisphaerales bacterium]|nr:pyruvate carboxyltransferase [Phycisphaerales bacterium]